MQIGFRFGEKDEKLSERKMKRWLKKGAIRGEKKKWKLQGEKRKTRAKIKTNWLKLFLKNRKWKITQIGFWFVEVREKLMELKIEKWAENEKTKAEKMQTASVKWKE